MTYTVTDRKRAAARRWQQRQRDALPLFGELIAEQQPSIDQVMSERIERWDESGRMRREHCVRQLAQLAAARSTPTRQRRVEPCATTGSLTAGLIGDPSYLLDMIHGLKTCRLSLADGIILQARIVISVGEATAMEGRRKPVSGGWLGKHT